MPAATRFFERRTWAKELLIPVLCSVALLACLAIANPFVNSAFNDDFSYSDTALTLAQTGQMHYDGWGSPTILFQCVWAAVFIHLFGFSFNILRYATLPFSIGFVCMTYFLARQVGLRSSFAGLATMVVAVSPLFVPLAASFMTEPYSCFFGVLCLYAALRSADGGSSGPAIRWLWVLTFSGILGGTDRQTVWLAPLLMIPYVAWVWRSSRHFLLNTVIAYSATLISLLLIGLTLKTKYAANEMSPKEWLNIVYYYGPRGAHYLVSVLLAGTLMCAPALLCSFPLWRRMPRRTLTLLLIFSIVLFDYLRSGFGRLLGIVPFVGNILTSAGVLDSLTSLSYRPDYLRTWLAYPLTFLLILLVGGWLGLTYNNIVSWRMPRHVWPLFAIFFFPYLLLLLPGALLTFAYDRYALPLMPMTLIVILFPVQSLLPRPPISAWILACLMGFYAVATTHDYGRLRGTLSTAASLLENRGISPTRISAGLEHDGWLQVRNIGTMEGANFKRPILGDHTHFGFWRITGGIRPDYVVIEAPLNEVPKDAIVTVPYMNWLPPRRLASFAVPKAKVRDLEP